MRIVLIVIKNHSHLTALCKEKGIKGYSGKNKAVLVDILTKNDIPPVSEPIGPIYYL